MYLGILDKSEVEQSYRPCVARSLIANCTVACLTVGRRIAIMVVHAIHTGIQKAVTTVKKSQNLTLLKSKSI